jgi:hypothetical protein
MGNVVVTESTVDSQVVIDTEHLKLLSIFHFVAAGFAFMGVAFATFNLVIFQVMFTNPEFWEKSQQGPPPQQVMAIFHWFLWVFVAWFLVGAVGNLLSGLFLRRRRHRVFSMVVAGLNCVYVPFGTILGIFTFVVLSRESVRRSYQE